jgi:hypothetical protein
LNSASAQDKDSVAVTAAFAKAYHLTSNGQLKPIAGTMIFGGPPELRTRADGLVGLNMHPVILSTINEISAKAIVLDHATYEQVAADWLNSAGVKS